MGQTTKLNWYRNSSINSTTHFNTLDISEVQLSWFVGFPFSRCFACKKKMEPSMVSYMRTVQNNRREDFNPKMVGLVGNVEYPPANKPQGQLYGMSTGKIGPIRSLSILWQIHRDLLAIPTFSQSLLCVSFEKCFFNHLHGLQRLIIHLFEMWCFGHSKPC